MPKHIKILPPIKLFTLEGDPIKDGEGKQATVTHPEFLFGRLKDPKFGSNGEWIVSQLDIRKALRETVDQNLEYLTIDKSDSEKLKDVTVNPSPAAAYNPHVAHNLMPYINSVKEPLDEIPKAKEEPKPELDAPPERAAAE